MHLTQSHSAAARTRRSLLSCTRGASCCFRSAIRPTRRGRRPIASSSSHRRRMKRRARDRMATGERTRRSSALSNSLRALGAAPGAFLPRASGTSRARAVSATRTRGRHRYEAFAARVRVREGDARQFVEPLTQRLRKLMDGPPFGAPERVESRAVDPATPAPRSVFVFHKSMPFKGHRAPVRACSAQRP